MKIPALVVDHCLTVVEVTGVFFNLCSARPTRNISLLAASLLHLVAQLLFIVRTERRMNSFFFK